MMLHLLLFLHLTSVIIWVGGMFFSYFCLRPAATQLLEPKLRLPLWIATFSRFFKLTAIAVVTIIATGIIMLLQVGMKFAPVGWHVMLSTGLLMSAIFIYVYAVVYPRLCKQCNEVSWLAAAATLNTIRKLVGFNLILSIIAIAAATFAR
jgi:uncharacterized membrane protein|tara:strand:- start:19773 stop:20222 length:450 start_codon:yes stop_codon:yes gene_type:complete